MWMILSVNFMALLLFLPFQWMQNNVSSMNRSCLDSFPICSPLWFIKEEYELSLTFSKKRRSSRWSTWLKELLEMLELLEPLWIVAKQKFEESAASSPKSSWSPCPIDSSWSVVAALLFLAVLVDALLEIFHFSFHFLRIFYCRKSPPTVENPHLL